MKKKNFPQGIMWRVLLFITGWNLVIVINAFCPLNSFGRQNQMFVWEAINQIVSVCLSKLILVYSLNVCCYVIFQEDDKLT